jgi:hypothetical protein
MVDFLTKRPAFFSVARMASSAALTCCPRKSTTGAIKQPDSSTGHGNSPSIPNVYRSITQQQPPPPPLPPQQQQQHTFGDDACSQRNAIIVLTKRWRRVNDARTGIVGYVRIDQHSKRRRHIAVVIKQRHVSGGAD